MKGMGAQMVGWRDQMETASTHLAAVLGLVERDGKAVRYARSPLASVLRKACNCLRSG